MKIIELIQEKLGIDAKDLDGDLDLNTVKIIQSNLNEIADDLTAKKVLADAEAEALETERMAERLAIARQKKHNIAKARKKAEQVKGYSPGRYALLKRLGKVD